MQKKCTVAGWLRPTDNHPNIQLPCWPASGVQTFCGLSRAAQALRNYPLLVTSDRAIRLGTGRLHAVDCTAALGACGTAYLPARPGRNSLFTPNSPITWSCHILPQYLLVIHFRPFTIESKMTLMTLNDCYDFTKEEKSISYWSGWNSTKGMLHTATMYNVYILGCVTSTIWKYFFP